MDKTTRIIFEGGDVAGEKHELGVSQAALRKGPVFTAIAGEATRFRESFASR